MTSIVSTLVSCRVRHPVTTSSLHHKHLSSICTVFPGGIPRSSLAQWAGISDPAADQGARKRRSWLGTPVGEHGFL